ncbi:cytochrome c oxidase subunit I [Salsipaludibacter albus]|uniref:cytochrome c oxidase subunit I n=1 Tax=Salsipaludibacter albus TaxID=2849650 RepID=UPI001EE43F71|nr:cytochrome c oxidase subunit I [Salsipaludibacter albus]MBY5161375.1 cytochrome c oxidase subunit I [Salsipaludibacter albus]
MTTTATTTERLAAAWGDQPGILGFLSSVDHKRVGRRYLVTAAVFLFLGGVQALLMRTQLIGPEAGVLSPEQYNELFTMHGTTMMLLFMVPAESAFANYFLPLMIGARDMAFPRLNMFSYWVFLFAGLFMYAGFVTGDVPDGGWFAYSPLVLDEFSPGRDMDFYAIGVIFLGLSTTAGAINFLVTTFKLRAPGMTVSRIPVFVWGIVAIAFMILFAFPSFTVAPLMLELSRALDMRFFDPSAGGDPLLWQHLFWFWGHPIVYIQLLPSTAIVSTIIPVFTRRRLVGYAWVVAAMLATAFISFGLWVHHMFVAGLPQLTTSFFSAVSLVVVVPSGIQFFAWLATIWLGRPRWDSPMLWAMGEMLLFLIGGITGVMVALVPFDSLAHDTHFVVAHFHYLQAGAVVFGLLAGLYYWFPKLTGRRTHRGVARLGFWTTFVGVNLTFMPLHWAGLWGMTRRIATYEPGLGFEVPNLLATIGSYVFGLGLLVVLGDLLWSWRNGPEAGPNPWGAGTLEWATSSPPPDHDFARLPIVRDRYPLWAGRTTPDDSGALALATDDDLALAPPDLHHEVALTAGPEGDPQQVRTMPGPSFAPLLVALVLTLLSIAMLLRSANLVLTACGLLVVSVGAWFWPREGS